MTCTAARNCASCATNSTATPNNVATKLRAEWEGRNNENNEIEQPAEAAASPAEGSEAAPSDAAPAAEKKAKGKKKDKAKK